MLWYINLFSNFLTATQSLNIMTHTTDLTHTNTHTHTHTHTTSSPPYHLITLTPLTSLTPPTFLPPPHTPTNLPNQTLPPKHK